MNLIGSKLQTLERKKKVLLVLGNDLILAFICWLVFGPPMATFIASEFSTGILEIFYSEWISFFSPLFLQFLIYISLVFISH